MVGFREFVRGFVVDPELERKAHNFVDSANNTAKRAERVAHDAEKLVGDAKRKLRLLNGAEVAIVATTMLIGAGVVMGTLMSKIPKENQES
jgi:hypothetical protein